MSTGIIIAIIVVAIVVIGLLAFVMPRMRARAAEQPVTLRTARPGLVIGPKGAEVDKLREELEDLIKRKVAPVKVIEIKNPDLNAQLVAGMGDDKGGGIAFPRIGIPLRRARGRRFGHSSGRTGSVVRSRVR